jgi:hypothetical protein
MLEMLERFPPALILLDVDMPEMSGYQAIKRGCKIFSSAGKEQGCKARSARFFRKRIRRSAGNSVLGGQPQHGQTQTVV